MIQAILKGIIALLMNIDNMILAAIKGVGSIAVSGVSKVASATASVASAAVTVAPVAVATPVTAVAATPTAVIPTL